MEKTHKCAQVVAVLLGVVTPCVLLAGYVYYLGYTMTFGLDPSVVSRSFGDVITESWYMGLLVIGYVALRWHWLLIGLVAVVLFFVGVMYWAVWWKSKGNKIPDQITKENQGRSVFGLSLWQWRCVLEVYEEAAIAPFLLLVLFTMSLFVAVVPYQKGEREAQRKIALYQDQGCATTANPDGQRCVSIVDFENSNVVVAEGVLVTASGDKIVLFSGGALEVWPLLPKFKIVRMYLTTLKK